jgi:hypothetical protein
VSATNRGAIRDPKDFYATPLTSFTPLIPFLPRVPTWEPAQGDGRLVRAMVASGIEAVGSDLFPKDGSEPIDFLKTGGHDYPCIVTNPPFSLAQEFIQHALDHAEHVYMLLRLNFLGAQCRREWWKQHEPNAIFVLSDRPKFCKNKHGKWSTDACEYGWFYWLAINGEPEHTGIHHL